MRTGTLAARVSTKARAKMRTQKRYAAVQPPRPDQRARILKNSSTQTSARETARKSARKLRLATNCARARDRVDISIMARSVEPVT
ncbi:hypothetical protein D3C72_1673040 [compost metagenome]